MNSKERVLTAFAHQQPDRVPIDYLAEPGIDERLKNHFGLEKDDDESLRKALGVDFRIVEAPYIGPKLHEDIPDRWVNIWGVRHRWVEHDTGGYWEYCDAPLKDATLEEIEAWPMPSPDDFDYSQIVEQCRRFKDYCIVAGGSGYGDVINKAGMVRGVEQALIDLITDEPVCLRYSERRVNVQVEIIRRALEAADGAIDLLWMGEDLGSQKGPLIGLDLYRRNIRPHHQKLIDLTKAYDIGVMIHCCGSSSWAFEDFIEMGITAVQTLQPEAFEMAPEYLKSRFGDKLAFHGCISTAGPVAMGTVDETIEDVRKTLDIMKPGGGYALAPTHKIQDNTPIKNIIAMYEAAKKYGKY